MNAPQIIVILLFAVRLLFAVFFHGEVRPAKKIHFMNAVLFIAIYGGLLWWGGFFAQGGAA